MRRKVMKTRTMRTMMIGRRRRRRRRRRRVAGRG